MVSLRWEVHIKQAEFPPLKVYPFTLKKKKPKKKKKHIYIYIFSQKIRRSVKVQEFITINSWTLTECLIFCEKFFLYLQPVLTTQDFSDITYNNLRLFVYIYIYMIEIIINSANTYLVNLLPKRFRLSASSDV